MVATTWDGGCPNCGHKFADLWGFSDDLQMDCLECDYTDQIKRGLGQ